MGLFDIFKKKEKEPEYDVTNLKVTDLNKGFILEYDLKSWEVKEVYEYDWGSNNFSLEYKLDSGADVVFLGVEDDGGLNLSVMKNIKIRDLRDDIIDKTIKKKRPPRQLDYEGISYHLHTDSAGYFNDKTKGTDDWEELISWEYYDDDEINVLSITQWGERNFEAAVGKVIKEYEISNIIPGS